MKTKAASPKTKTASRLSSTPPRHVVSDGTTDVRIQATHLDLADIAFESPDKVKTVTLFAMTVTINKAAINLPGEVVTIVADRMEGTGATITLKTDHFYFHFRECKGRVKISSPGNVLIPEIFNGKSGRSIKRDAFRKDFTVINEEAKIAEHNGTRKQYEYTYVIQPPKNERLVRLEEDWCQPVIPAPALKAIAPLAIPAVLDARISRTLALTEANRQGLCSYLGWLIRSIPPGTVKNAAPDILQLRQLATHQLLMFQMGPRSNYVPYLTPNLHEKRLGNLLSALKHLEDKVGLSKFGGSLQKSFAALDKRIASQGQKAAEFVQALAANEADMEGHYAAIIGEKTSRINLAKAQVEDCNARITEWNVIFTARLEAYKKAVKSESLWDSIFAVAGCVVAVVAAAALFVPTAGTSMVAATGACFVLLEDVPVKMTRLVKGLEKLIKIIEAVYQIYATGKDIFSSGQDYDSLGRAIGKAKKSSVKEYQNIKIPTDAEWEEAMNEFEASLPVSDAKDARQELVAAYRNAISWARSCVKIVVEVIQCQSEIDANQRLRDISKAQKDRLQNIKTDPASLGQTDWAKMELDVTIIEKTMQARLVDVFTDLARACEYQFDVSIEPLQSSELDLISLRLRLDKLWQQAYGGSGPHKPIKRKDMRVVFPDRPANSLIGGRFVNCPVTIKSHLASVFSNYASIRITNMRVELSVTRTTGKGKKKGSANVLRVTTEGARGEYMVEWHVSGEQFFDVTGSRQVIEHSCDPLTGTSSYECKGNKLVETSVGSWAAENTMNITPFTNWQVSVPPQYTETNKGLKLEVPDAKGKKMEPATKVDITLVFDIEAVTIPRVVNPTGRTLMGKQTGQKLTKKKTADKPTLKKTAAKLAKKKSAGRSQS